MFKDRGTFSFSPVLFECFSQSSPDFIFTGANLCEGSTSESQQRSIAATSKPHIRRCSLLFNVSKPLLNKSKIPTSIPSAGKPLNPIRRSYILNHFALLGRTQKEAAE